MSQVSLQTARKDHSKEMERASMRLEQLASEVARVAAERDHFLQQVGSDFWDFFKPNLSLFDPVLP